MAQPARQELLKDPVIARVRDIARTLYGAQLDRVVLFGSRARGEARSDSDYDFAIFVNGLSRNIAEVDRLSDALWEVEVSSGIGIDAFPFPPADLEAPTLFMQEVRQDGVEL